MLTLHASRTFTRVAPEIAADVPTPTRDDLRAHKIGCSRRGVTRANLGARWAPLSHATVLDGVHTFGAIEDKRVYLTEDHQGLLVTGQLPDLGEDSRSVPSFALWHDNFQRRSLRLAVGATVCVCENGMITGQYTFRRKHTTGLDPAEIFAGFSANIRENARHQAADFRQLRRGALDDPAESLLELAATQALPARVVPEAWYHFVNPTHEEFRDGGSAWCWYQAVNTAAKRLAPDTQTRALAGAWSIVSAALLN